MRSFLPCRHPRDQRNIRSVQVEGWGNGDFTNVSYMCESCRKLKSEELRGRFTEADVDFAWSGSADR
jgi:hypothetical protein